MSDAGVPDVAQWVKMPTAAVHVTAEIPTRVNYRVYKLLSLTWLINSCIHDSSDHIEGMLIRCINIVDTLDDKIKT